MRLFEAILDANQRATPGDGKPALDPAGFADALPLIILTCMDPRLNRAIPRALNLPEESYFWIRNAGNVVTGPLGGAVRSLALACSMRDAREIAIVGHTDCVTCHTTAMKLTDAFKALGINRDRLPENLTDFFGMFASEQQNVIKGVDYVRQSPLIGAKVPVHGLLLDLATGKLQWTVNGYQNLPSGASLVDQAAQLADQSGDLLKSLPKFDYGEMKFPDLKIGEAASKAGELASSLKIGDTPIGEVAAKVGDLVADLQQPAQGMREKIDKARHVVADAQDIVSQFLQPQGKGQKPAAAPHGTSTPAGGAPSVARQKPPPVETGRTRPPRYAKTYGPRKNP